MEDILSMVLKGIAENLLALIATIIALFIGWKQYRIERYQLRLALFEKRFQIYEKFKEVNKNFRQKANFSYPDMIIIHMIKEECIFIFGKDVLQYLKEYRDLAAKHREQVILYKKILPETPLAYLSKEEVTEEMEETNKVISRKMFELVKQLERHYEKRQDVFGKYIDFSKIH